jgi:hypothetical protein
MIWKVPKLWEGGECWIIGGGPSIPYEFGVPQDVIDRVQSGELSVAEYSPYLSAIHDRHVIGVNAAFLLGAWIDFVFFGDGGFYFKNREALLKFPKPKVTCNPNLNKKGVDDGVKWIPRDGKRRWGITDRPNRVCWNSNSGGAAINFAHHLGAKRIYLLGFDMSLGVHSNQHWHRHYMPPGKNKDPKRLPFDRHRRTFGAVAKDAKSLGIEIINVSQNSTIEEFPKKKISEIL